MILFMLIFPLFVKHKQQEYKIIYALVLIALSVDNFFIIDISFPLQDKKLFTPSEYTQNVETMSAILSTQQKNTPFITQWWGTAADLEYTMSTHLNFTTFQDSDISLDYQYVLAVNTKFLLNEDTDFVELISQCETNQIGQYVYGVCDPQISDN